MIIGLGMGILSMAFLTAILICHRKRKRKNHAEHPMLPSHAHFHTCESIGERFATSSSMDSVIWCINLLNIPIHTIRKVKFCPKIAKIQFWQNPKIFTSFSSKLFWQFFSWNQSCQQLKSPKSQHFHKFFTQKIDNFHRKSKLNFWTRNEDFEQCVIVTKMM